MRGGGEGAGAGLTCVNPSVAHGPVEGNAGSWTADVTAEHSRKGRAVARIVRVRIKGAGRYSGQLGGVGGVLCWLIGACQVCSGFPPNGVRSIRLSISLLNALVRAPVCV